MCGQWSKNGEDLKSKTTLFLRNLHLLPAPQASFAHMEYKNQFFTRTKNWLWNSPVISWIGLQSCAGQQRAHPAEGRKKALCTVSEKSLRWSLFSRSLDSVLDLGDQWHQDGLVSYSNHSIELNELKRGKKLKKIPENMAFWNMLLTFPTLQTEFLKYNNFWSGC